MVLQVAAAICVPVSVAVGVVLQMHVHRHVRRRQQGRQRQRSSLVESELAHVDLLENFSCRQRRLIARGSSLFSCRTERQRDVQRGQLPADEDGIQALLQRLIALRCLQSSKTSDLQLREEGTQGRAWYALAI